MIDKQLMLASLAGYNAALGHYQRWAEDGTFPDGTAVNKSVNDAIDAALPSDYVYPNRPELSRQDIIDNSNVIISETFEKIHKMGVLLHQGAESIYGQLKKGYDRLLAGVNAEAPVQEEALAA